MSGVSILCASLLAGWLRDSQGAASTFYAGATFCVAALGALLAGGLRSDVLPLSGRIRG